MNKANENIIQTPNLDQLAADGVILKSFYTQSVCTPTRASLLTGKYTIHLGLQHSIVQSGHPSALGTEHRTLAEELKKRNYATHMVGKWHLGYYQKKFQPLRRGFDTFKGMLTGAEYYFSHVARCEFPFYEFKGSTSGWGLDWFEGEEAAWEEEGRYSTDLLTQRAEEIIWSHSSSSSVSMEGEMERPLFLYLPYQAVHGRLQAPEEDIARFAHVKDKNRRIYAAMVWKLDQGVGNVTKALKKAGLYENSVIVFTTDNGGDPIFGGNNWPLRGKKGSYWEGGVRGAAFVHSPLLEERGVERGNLMHVVDWFPTILGLVDRAVEREEKDENALFDICSSSSSSSNNSSGSSSSSDSTTSSISGSIDGIDQWATISHGAPAPRHELLHTIDALGLDTGDPLTGTKQAAIRQGPWKLLLGAPGQNIYQDKWTPPPHWTPPGKKGSKLAVSPLCGNCIFTKENLTTGVCLFNIEDDPEERCNLAGTQKMVVTQLLARLEAWNATAVPAHYPGPDKRCDPSLHDHVFTAWGEEETG